MFVYFSACTIEKPTDIVFVIDDKSGSTQTIADIWKFIRSVVSDIDMTNHRVRIKFVHDCEEMTGVHLGDFENKTDILYAIDNMKMHASKSAELLRSMTETLSTPQENTLIERDKIGIYITDGSSGDIHATLTEAQGAKLIHNIEMFGVGIGRDIDPTELRGLVSCEVENHLFTVPHSKKLPDVKRLLTKELCSGTFAL